MPVANGVRWQGGKEREGKVREKVEPRRGFVAYLGSFGNGAARFFC